MTPIGDKNIKLTLTWTKSFETVRLENYNI